MAWFKDTKDADKIALMLIGLGVLLIIFGTVAILIVIFWIDNESKLDRAILAITALSSQGSGLVTAAMGILRLQQKDSTPPPATGFDVTQRKP